MTMLGDNQHEQNKNKGAKPPVSGVLPGPLQIKLVRNPVRQDVVPEDVRSHRVGLLAIQIVQPRPVIAHDAHIYAYVLPAPAGRPRALEGLVNHLQEKPLLGIHEPGLLLTERPNVRVNLGQVDVVQIVPVLRTDEPGPPRLVPVFDVVAIFRNAAVAASAVHQEVPVLVSAGHFPGQP